MSELVAPFSKQHLFLTLSQYNKTDESVLARCEIHKDQPFFPASSGTFLATESFRLSLFGNPKSGYVYQYIQPDWFIAATRENPDIVEQEFQENTNLCTGQVLFSADNNPAENFIELHAIFQDAEHETNLGRILETFAGELNDERFNRNSVIRIPPAQNFTPQQLQNFTLTEKPSLNLRGVGFGPQGLGVLRGTIESLTPDWERDIPDQLDGNGHPHRFQVQFKILKKELPSSTTVEDIAIYLSSGVHLWPDIGSVGNNEALMTVMGPYSIEVDNIHNEEETVELVGPREDVHVPNHVLWCNDEESYTTGGTINVKHAVSEFIHQTYTGHVREVGPEWINEAHDAYYFGLYVKWASDQAKGVASGYTTGFLTWPNNFINNRSFYVYTLGEGKQLVRNVSSEVNLKYAGTATVTDINYGHDDITEALPLYLSEVAKNELEIVGRSWSDTQVGVMTPNEMYSMFNVPHGFSADSQPWIFNTHENGGFTITITEEDLCSFSISKNFADSLGLDPVIVQESYTKKTDNRQLEKIIMIIPIMSEFTIPTDEGVQVVNNIIFDVADGFANNVIEDSPENYFFEGIAGQATDESPIKSQEAHDNLGAVVVNIRTRKRFKLVNVQTSRKHVISKRKIRIEPQLRLRGGVEYYYWSEPPNGGYIPNFSNISVESFSLFEGIMIVAPSLPFQGMVTSFSSSMRVLTELRLPFPYSGNSNEVGHLVNTTDSMIGDIIWSANNGHQYVPVSAVGDIYNLVCQALLVFRNCNEIPPRPVHIGKNGIFMVKIRMLEVK